MPLALPVLLLAACGGSVGRPDLSLLDDGVVRIGVLERCPQRARELPGETLRGCLDGTPERAVDVARQLVEGDGVDLLLAYPADREGYALALYVRSQPDKTLVLGSSALQATTLDVGARNVFRYVPDAAQRAAGLGTHAYRALGWRTAAVAGATTALAREQDYAFAAEFCSLGGRVVEAGADGRFVSTGARARLEPGPFAAFQELDAEGILHAALRAVGGELADGHEALRRELRRGLDENGQAIVDVRLVERGRTVRLLTGVEQTFGGLFGPETSPPRDSRRCERGNPPPWAE